MFKVPWTLKSELKRASIVAGGLLLVRAARAISGYRQKLMMAVNDESRLRRVAEQERESIATTLDQLRSVQAVSEKTEARLRTIIESLPAFGAWLYGPKGEPIYISSSFLELLDMTAEQAAHLGWVQRVKEEDRERLIQKWNECLRVGSGWEDEVDIVDRWGHTHTLLCRGRPVRASSGQIVGWVGVKLDMTEIRKAEEALRKNEIQFRHFVEGNLLGVLRIDGDGHIRQANDYFLKMLGYTRAEMATKPVCWHDIALDPLSLERARTSKKPIELELRAVDGRIVPALFGATSGEGETTIGFAVDRSEAKRTQEELVSAKERAEGADRAKSVFLANMSHEIRTPLGAIIGFAELLSDPAQTEEQRASHLETIIKNGQQLTRIINDILDLSKIDSETFSIVSAPFSLRELLDDLRSLLQPQALAKHLDLRFACKGEVPDILKCDAGRIKQVLVNVIGNAIKFTENGYVSVEVSAEPQRVSVGESATIEFRVEDTGIGLDAEERGRIFKAFSQAQSSIARMYGGTGLGLFLSRRLAQAMGGDLLLDRSERGQGSEFRLSLKAEVLSEETFREIRPRAPRKASGQSRALRSTRLKGKSLLVVDDSPDLQRLIRHFLVSSGAQVELADNGIAGIKAATEGDFDVVVMDIEMPMCSGYEAIKRLRERGYEGKVVALTAHAMRGEREHCLSSGFDEYLVKPIDRAALIDTVLKLSPTEETAVAREPEAHAPL